MKIDINQLIELYDTRHKKWSDETGSPISSITGLIGEDLVLGILEYYFINDKKLNVHIDRRSPVAEAGGKKLDAWILADSIEEYYQVEIKNWSASAKDGKDVTKSDEGLIKAAVANHKTYLMRKDKKDANSVWKVLEEIRADEIKLKINKRYKRKALLAFWSPVAKSLNVKAAEDLEPFFKIDIADSSYKDSINSAGIKQADPAIESVYIFSASLYLRELLRQNNTEISINMPRVDDRIKKIKSLLPNSF